MEHHQKLLQAVESVVLEQLRCYGVSSKPNIELLDLATTSLDVELKFSTKLAIKDIEQVVRVEEKYLQSGGYNIVESEEKFKTEVNRVQSKLSSLSEVLSAESIAASQGLDVDDSICVASSSTSCFLPTISSLHESILQAVIQLTKTVMRHGGKLIDNQLLDFRLAPPLAVYKQCEKCHGTLKQACPHCSEENGEKLNDCPTCNATGQVECPKCKGAKAFFCTHCHGNGKERCPKCTGRGLFFDTDGSPCDVCEEGIARECKYCHGAGRIECDNCNGTGSITCPDCNGSGKQECSYCHGQGTIPCKECLGTGGSAHLFARRFLAQVEDKDFNFKLKIGDTLCNCGCKEKDMVVNGEIDFDNISSNSKSCVPWCKLVVGLFEQELQLGVGIFDGTVHTISLDSFLDRAQSDWRIKVEDEIHNHEEASDLATDQELLREERATLPNLSDKLVKILHLYNSVQADKTETFSEVRTVSSSKLDFYSTCSLGSLFRLKVRLANHDFFLHGVILQNGELWLEQYNLVKHVIHFNSEIQQIGYLVNNMIQKGSYEAVVSLFDYIKHQPPLLQDYCKALLENNLEKEEQSQNQKTCVCCSNTIVTLESRMKKIVCDDLLLKLKLDMQRAYQFLSSFGYERKRMLNNVFVQFGIFNVLIFIIMACMTAFAINSEFLMEADSKLLEYLPSFFEGWLLEGKILLLSESAILSAILAPIYMSVESIHRSRIRLLNEQNFNRIKERYNIKLIRSKTLEAYKKQNKKGESIIRSIAFQSVMGLFNFSIFFMIGAISIYLTAAFILS